MSKKQGILGVVIFVVALICIYFVQDYLRFVTTDNAQVEAHSLLLASKVGGYIVEVPIRDGQRVKKGDVLVRIDDRDYQNSVHQIQSEVGSLEAQRRDSEKNFRRLSELYKKSVVSQQQFDTSSAGYLQIKAKYDAVSAQLAQAQLNLENTVIRAPSDGVIARRSAEIGQLAAPGTPLIGFVDSTERWVTANFKETEIADVVIGREVEIEVDGISGRSFKGRVESVSPSTGATFTLLPPDNATGNFTKVVQRIPTRIVFESLDDEARDLLRAGMSVVVKVHKR
jgi:membrane fusion protein (multidrug efflux system)